MSEKQTPAADAGTHESAKPTRAGAPAPSDERKPLEQWANEQPVKGISARMIRLEMRWGEGREITLEEYTSAVERIAKTPIGYKQLGMQRNAPIRPQKRGGK